MKITKMGAECQIVMPKVTSYFGIPVSSFFIFSASKGVIFSIFEGREPSSITIRSRLSKMTGLVPGVAKLITSILVSSKPGIGFGFFKYFFLIEPINHPYPVRKILISNNEYWIGYGIDVTGDYPSSVDAGPAVPEKGDWMYFYSSGWFEISVAYGLDYNWCITGILSPIDSNDKSESVEIGQANKLSNNDITRDLIGYKIYRDGVVIAEILDPNQTTYEDLALNSGVYEYGITAVYDEGESIPLSAEVIIILVAPQNFCAVVQEMNNVFCSWDSLDSTSRDFDYFNVYRDNLLIATGINENFYLDVEVPAGTHDYCGTAVYDGGWESELSNPATVTVDIGDLPIPLVTELIGNYPNPFNPTTTISFSLTAEDAEIIIYNIKGHKIKTFLINSSTHTPINSIIWDGKDSEGKDVASGIYFYKMKAGKYVSTKKMILMK